MFDFLNPEPITPTQKMTGQPTSDAGAPDLKSQWDSYLSDPTTRAAMLSAGLSMLTPQWGGPTAAIARGIGAGAETVADRQAMEKADAEKQQSRSDKLNEQSLDHEDKAANRANALEIAKMNNSTRWDLGNLKAAGGTGGQNKAATVIQNNAVKIANSLRANQVLSGLTDAQIQQMAMEQAISAYHGATEAIGGSDDLAGTGSASGAGGDAPIGSEGQGAAPGPNSQTNSPIRKQGRDKSGNVHWYTLKDGKWVKE